MRIDPDALARRHLANEIGDTEPPLEADLEKDLHTEHPLVGREVEVSSSANDLLKSYHGNRGTITGAIVKNGQIAGYRVEIDGKKFYAPKKSFFLDRQYVEDVHLNTDLAEQVRQSLGRWSQQRDYHGPAWEGVEDFCFNLANATNTAGVQAVGWYKYQGSTRAGMDGKDWRYVIPDRGGNCVAVNCHSLLHDSVWTLSTTIFSTREILGVATTSSADHWQRTLMWTWETALKLSSHGFDYSKVTADYSRRLASIQPLRKLFREMLPELAEAYREVMGTAPEFPSFSIGPSYARLGPNSVGRHEPPTEGRDYSVISVTPLALDDPDYLREIVRHEMIHYALRTDCMRDSHGSEFQEIAEKLGIPEEYRD